MDKLRRFTLSRDQQKGDWTLKNNATGKIQRRFNTKADGTKGGVLRQALGKEGGSVQIEKVRGGYDEERTFPKSRDPRSSKG